MKLIYAIINQEDSHSVEQELLQGKFSVTKLASTGGFLKKGNTTLFIATEKEQVELALTIIQKNAKTRIEKTLTSSNAPFGANITQSMDVTVGGAIVFITDIERFEKY